MTYEIVGAVIPLKFSSQILYLTTSDLFTTLKEDTVAKAAKYEDIYIFNEIPMAADISFRRSLDHVFFEKECFRHYHNFNICSPEIWRWKFAEYPDLNFDDVINSILLRNARLIVGHFGIAEKYGFNNFVRAFPLSRLITFLRNPRNRICSAFMFSKKYFAVRKSFEEFIEQPYTQNCQTRNMCGVALDKFVHVGLAERYGDSLDVLFDKTGLKLHTERRDVNPNIINDTYDLSRFGDKKVWARFDELNQADILFYGQAAARLEDEVSNLRGNFKPRKKIMPLLLPRENFNNNPALSFCDQAFCEKTLERYKKTDAPFPALSYATVRDYCDNWDHLTPLTRHGGLKNVQLPWALKAVLSRIPSGGKLLEFGAGQPLIAATLARMGYGVTIVDPYDGTGNGPTEYERHVREFPELRLIRGYFQPAMAELSGEERSFEAVYSMSVIEHLPLLRLNDVFAAMRMYLKPTGFSLHAIDFICKGNGANEHREILRTLTQLSGVYEEEVRKVLRQLNEDTETYYLSAEAHNALRMARTYDEFPMRVCVSIELTTSASELSSLNEKGEYAVREQQKAHGYRCCSDASDFSWAKPLSNEEWAKALAISQGPNGEILPPNPSDEVQKKYNSQAGFSVYLRAITFIEKMKHSLAISGFEIHKGISVLDCGVGWGRIYRAMLRDIDPSSFLGVDIDPDAISMCKQAMPYGQFELISQTPPHSNLHASSYDLVYLHSVFSHLSENGFKEMMSEFCRIINSGGFLVFTTLKSAHLNVWNSRMESGRSTVLKTVGFNLNQWQHFAERGQFLYVPTGGGDPIRPNDYYGEAIVTEKFLNSVKSQFGFDLITFEENSGMPQSFVVMQKL